MAVEADDVLLDGADATYDARGPRILISKALAPEAAALHLAHEYGHR